VCLRFWRSNLTLHCSPPPISCCVVSPRRFLTLILPSAVLTCCLQLTLFTPHRSYSLVSLSPRLSLCFSFATHCTRVKTIFFWLRAVMMRDIYSFLLTVFPVFLLFLWACLFLVRLQLSPCIYAESVARFPPRSSNRHEDMSLLTNSDFSTKIAGPDTEKQGHWHLWDQANDTDASRFEGKMHLVRRRQRISASSAPLSDGSDRIGLVSADWLLVRFNPRRADERRFSRTALSTFRYSGQNRG
jgi:hypothetical protein